MVKKKLVLLLKFLRQKKQPNQFPSTQACKPKSHYRWHQNNKKVAQFKWT